MAKKLEINLDELSTTYNLYVDKYDELSTTFTNLKTAINNLRYTDWKSAASTQYFSNFDNSWVNDMQKQLDIVGEVRDLLKDASDTYENIENKISEIRA